MNTGLTWKAEDQQLLDKIASHPRLILAINKVDTVDDKARLLPHLQFLSQKAPFRQLIPISAKSGHNVDRLEQEIIALLPTAPPFYDSDQVTDRSLRFLAAELIREALRNYTRQTKHPVPPGVGKYHSGRKDLSERAEEILAAAAKQGKWR